MTEEYWWEAHGVLLRKFSSFEEGKTALNAETNPVVFITGHGWNIEVSKSDIRVVSRKVKTSLI
jgi:lauroyl/myristoyl acyltransferase